MRTLLRETVATWSGAYLNSFNSTFEISRLLRAVDDSNFSIQSSDASIFIEKTLDPDLGRMRNYEINFGTQIVRGIGADRLSTTPYFALEDAQGIERQCYIEESPYSFTGVEAIEIINPGTGYTSTPTIKIDGDGVGANAYAVIVNGRIKTVIVDKKGTDYTTAVVTVSGGGGTRASLNPIIQGRVGTLRTFYFRPDKIKVILNDDAGSVDYLTGKVNLTNFRPLDVGNVTKKLSFIAKPYSTVFSSEKNRLVTYDPNNVSALKITLQVVES
jgi:hypothetical protein